MDYGHKQTDKMLKDLEKRIQKEYEQAAREVEVSMNKWLGQYKKNDLEMRNLWKSGAITKQEYTDWRNKQIILSNKWKSQRDELTAVFMDADKVASGLITDHRYETYALNYNYGTYEAEKGARLNTSFTLYDKDTVARLVKDDPKLLPPLGASTSDKIRRGELKKWNNKLIQSVMIQGVLQGESIQKISKRLAKTVGEKNAYSHYRAARTMTTSAENAGRMDSYKRAEDMGIKMGKTWLAVHDERTRSSHIAYDGMTIPIDKEFAKGLKFPADPDADPSEVYNCRCTMIAKVMSVNGVDISGIGSKPWQDEWNIDYDAWKKSKIKPLQTQPPQTQPPRAKSRNIFGETINYSKAFTDGHPEAKRMVEELASEFNTKVKEVGVGRPLHDKAGGGVQISGTIMKVSNFSDLSSTIHEFAHTISMQRQTKFGLYNEADFWKEIKKVRRAYRKNVGDDTSRWISQYANQSDDEFLAECFAHAIMREKNIDIPSQYGNDFEYSNMVLQIVRKYFGRR